MVTNIFRLFKFSPSQARVRQAHAIEFKTIVGGLIYSKIQKQNYKTDKHEAALLIFHVCLVLDYIIVCKYCKAIFCLFKGGKEYLMRAHFGLPSVISGKVG